MTRWTVALAIALATASSAMPAGAADKNELKAKYEGKAFVLQHNLHVDDNVAEWQNFIEGDFVPLGSKVTVQKIDPKRAVLVFEDPPRTVRLDLDDAIPDATVILDHILALYIQGSASYVIDDTTFATLGITITGTTTDICAALS